MKYDKFYKTVYLVSWTLRVLFDNMEILLFISLIFCVFFFSLLNKFVNLSKKTLHIYPTRMGNIGLDGQFLFYK